MAGSKLGDVFRKFAVMADAFDVLLRELPSDAVIVGATFNGKEYWVDGT